VWLDWEGVIIHDALDNVFFCLVFVLVQVICVQSVVEKSYGSVFVLCWVVGGVWDDSVCESGFPIYGYLSFRMGSCGW
jgi:hypothetical protein